MKKTNFIVVFFLLIVLISFVSFLINLQSFLDSISYVIIPDTADNYMNYEMINRNFITTIPMLIFTAFIGSLSFKKGLNMYQDTKNDTP